MPQPVQLSFSGELDLDWLEIHGQEVRILGFLREQSKKVSEEISERIAEWTGAGPPDVTIHFAAGTIHWFGSVQWAHDSWKIVQIMSGFAGAISFVNFVREAIDTVLRQWFRRAVGPQFSLMYVGTRVLLVSDGRANQPIFRVHDRLFGIAALIVSAAALIAAIGLFIRLVR